MPGRRVLAAATSTVAVTVLTALPALTGLGGAAGGATAGPAGTPHPEDWCSQSKPAPCVLALSQDGTAIPSTSPTWVASIADTGPINGDSEVQWSVSNQDAGVHDNGSVYSSMGDDQSTHLWSITVRVDSDPRSISAYADQLQTSVTDNGDGTWDVTTTGYPVTTGVNDECQPVTPETCPHQAGADVTLFQMQSDDFQFSATPAGQWNDYTGLREWTNVEESDLPPQVSGDPLQITEQLTNSHELATGDVFHGFFHAVLPNAFLVDMGIDDPATIDPGSISTSIGTGAGSISVVPGPTSTEVDITGITFSHRVVRIKRGTITPGRPRITAAKRSSSRVRLDYGRARERGSRILRYDARCLAHGRPARTAGGRGARLTVRHLAAGVTYSCQVRARAKAGFGAWSKRRTVRG